MAHTIKKDKCPAPSTLFKEIFMNFEDYLDLHRTEVQNKGLNETKNKNFYMNSKIHLLLL
jgi:hypothetical protein